MINFLDVKNFKKGLKPITTTEIFSKPGEFHSDGLFSETIFGPEESLERKKTFSYIDLNATVIHPSAYMLLIQLDRKIELLVSAQETFSVDSKGTLQQDPDGVTGISSFIDLLPKIKLRGGTGTRDKFVKKIQDSYKNNTLFIDLTPVIPPAQRDAYQDEKGMWVIDPLNDYYITIIRRAYQVKSAAKAGALFDLLNFELQKAIINHDNFIRKLIQKKRGLIRSQMLGKRTDFSGRAVVTPGPKLKVNEIGIPLRMAISLFEPFIIHRLFHSGRVDPVKLGSEVKKFTGIELSIDSMKNVFKAIKSGDDIPKALHDIIFEATEVSMMNRVVLAKRDPVLHAESIRAFEPILITGDTVQLCTLQVGGFNADFDGDTMGIFHPITNEAQEEARTRMMRSESGETDNAVTFELSKEMCVGLFTITKDVRRTASPISVIKIWKQQLIHIYQLFIEPKKLQWERQFSIAHFLLLFHFMKEL
jgi:DNA-directed RNA polymerase beta' subunit